uniref:Snake toxin/toxin-like domain-containing protein n=1 Tax=Paramormyrops kingsleyae TaxID=1676925 RepID=A0A3B3Q5L1_9TELE
MINLCSSIIGYSRAVILPFTTQLLDYCCTDGLKCYTCKDTDNATCNKNPVTCQASHDTCMSAVETSTAASAASAASMIQAVTNLEPPIVTCCSTDLCNFSGATTARLHTLLLVLPLCVISALCYVST